jgi:hypothetical protein
LTSANRHRAASIVFSILARGQRGQCLPCQRSISANPQRATSRREEEAARLTSANRHRAASIVFSISTRGTTSFSELTNGGVILWKFKRADMRATQSVQMCTCGKFSSIVEDLVFSRGPRLFSRTSSFLVSFRVFSFVRSTKSSKNPCTVCLVLTRDTTRFLS